MQSAMKSALFAAMMSASPALAAAPADNPYMLLREGYAAADGARAATAGHVFFKSGDLDLAGDLYLPGGARGRRPAVVLILGSGPQDRHGYASIIELMARRFADAVARR